METMNNRNNRKSIYALIGGLILVVVFQNFQIMPDDLMGLQPVDENLRETHARELLGSGYRKSTAAQKAQLANLHFKLYLEVRKQLPNEHKTKAFRTTQAILRESARHNFDPVFVAAVIKTESQYNPLAIGGVGEIGLMQIRPETAAWIAKKYSLRYDGAQDLKDPAKNVKIGVAYMAYLRDTFPKKAYRYIAAYNMGPGNVRKLISQNIKPQEYSTRIYRNYHETYSSLVSKPVNTDSVASL